MLRLIKTILVIFGTYFSFSFALNLAGLEASCTRISFKMGTMMNRYLRNVSWQLTVAATLVRAIISIAIVGIFINPHIAFSQTQDNSSPANELEHQLLDFRGLTTSLVSRADKLNTIANSDINSIQKEIDQVQKDTLQLLNAVSDNGPLTKAATKAVNWAETQRKRINDSTDFPPEQKASLMSAWSERSQKFSVAASELKVEQKELFDALQSIIGNKRYLAELILLDKSSEALKIIQSIIQDIRAKTHNIDTHVKQINVPTS